MVVNLLLNASVEQTVWNDSLAMRMRRVGGSELRVARRGHLNKDMGTAAQHRQTEPRTRDAGGK